MGGLGYNPVDKVWEIKDDWQTFFKAGKGGFGLAGKMQGQVASMPAVVTASYGAVASQAGQVAVADLNSAIGSLTYMINSVGGAVGTVQNLLRLYGLMK